MILYSVLCEVIDIFCSHKLDKLRPSSIIRVVISLAETYKHKTRLIDVRPSRSRVFTYLPLVLHGSRFYSRVTSKYRVSTLCNCYRVRTLYISNWGTLLQEVVGTVTVKVCRDTVTAEAVNPTTRRN